MTREERRAAAKAKKEAAIARKKGQVQAGDMPSSSEEESDDDMPANPNHSKAARNQAKSAPVDVDEATDGVKDLSVGGKAKKPIAELSRREREAVQAQQARERYQKLHEAGKTDEAKADLARLKVIREKREAEAARKQVCIRYIYPLYQANEHRPRKKSVRRPKRPRKQKSRRERRRGERLLWVPRRARQSQRSRCWSEYLDVSDIHFLFIDAAWLACMSCLTIRLVSLRGIQQNITHMLLPIYPWCWSAI